ncbi:MAG: hypothetical protein ABI433_09075 [Burkholderiaceae bacterium]
MPATPPRRRPHFPMLIGVLADRYIVNTCGVNLARVQTEPPT